MKLAKLIALLGAVVMGLVIVYGFVVGDIAADAAILLGNPWGIVSLVDLYTGFALFSIWIVYRERSAVRAVPWIIGMIVLGNFTGGIYMLYALVTSGGDWRRAWLGRHADG